MTESDTITEATRDPQSRAAVRSAAVEINATPEKWDGFAAERIADVLVTALAGTG